MLKFITLYVLGIHTCTSLLRQQHSMHVWHIAIVDKSHGCIINLLVLDRESILISVDLYGMVDLTMKLH